MSIVVVLSLALSASQVEEIIVDQFPEYEVQQVIPTSHKAVEYEWRIEGWEPEVFGREATPRELAAIGNRILDALGTRTSYSEWDFFGLLNPELDAEELMKHRILLRGKRDNVAFEWSASDGSPALRILVFDPAMISPYSEGEPE